MTAPNQIGIYAGSESSYAFIRNILAPCADYGLQPRLVSLDDVMKDNILHPGTTPLVALFLMGGRNNARFRQDMGKRGFDLLRQFVWHGGHITGVCRGAAPGGYDVEYESCDGRVTNSDNMNFMRVTSYGELPLGQDMKSPDGWPTATATALLLPQHNNIETRGVYWRGCGIRPHAGETLTVLARFKTLTEADGSNVIAVARKQFGRGTFTASAVHIELNAAIMRSHPNSSSYDRGDNGARRLAIAEELEASADGLNKLMGDVLAPIVADRTYTPGTVWNAPQYA